MLLRFRSKCCIAKNNYTYTYAFWNIFNTITTSGHSSLEKYTSLFIERVVCERWVGNWTELQHIDPLQLFWLSQPFFPVLLGCSTGGHGGGQPLLGHGSHFSIFSPTDLNFLSPGLYNNLTPTYFLRASQFALNSTLRQSRLSPDLFDQMHLLFTQMHFSFDSLAGSEVNMQQQVTIRKGINPTVLLLLQISVCIYPAYPSRTGWDHVKFLIGV